MTLSKYGRALLIASFTLTGAAHAVQNGPNPTLEGIKADGPYAVSSQALSGSGKPFSRATVYSPNTPGAYAVIAVCPGYVSAETAIQQLGRRLATHGFVVVTIQTKSLFNWPSSRATQLLAALQATTQLTTGPAAGKMDATRMAVAGWSMGGGGALEAAGKTPALKAALAWAPWHTSTTDISKIVMPASITVGTADSVASLEGHSQKFYNAIPASTRKMLGVIEGADHFVYSGKVVEPISYTNIAWTKRFVDGDTRYSPFLPAAQVDWASFTSNGPF